MVFCSKRCRPQVKFHEQTVGRVPMFARLSATNVNRGQNYIDAMVLKPEVEILMLQIGQQCFSSV